MKRVFCLILTAALLLLTACGGREIPAPEAPAEDLPPARQEEPAPAETASPEASAPVETLPEETSPEETEEPAPAETVLTLTVGERTFSATLEDSETARQLAALLPLTLDMSELNGNEKYFYLSSALPTDSLQPGQISAGDLMLYGNNCLVLFYQSFSSGYAYTRLGRVDDPAGLADALGSGRVTVTLSLGD